MATSMDYKQHQNMATAAEPNCELPSADGARLMLVRHLERLALASRPSFFDYKG